MSFQFPVRTAFVLSVFFAGAFALFHFLATPDLELLQEYLSTSGGESAPINQQERWGVCKELVFEDKTFRLNGKKSTLNFLDGELVEELVEANGTITTAKHTLSFASPLLVWNWANKVFFAQEITCDLDNYRLVSKRMDWDPEKGVITFQEPVIRNGERVVSSVFASVNPKEETVDFIGKTVVLDADFGEYVTDEALHLQMAKDKLVLAKGSGSEAFICVCGVALSSYGSQYDPKSQQIVLMQGPSPLHLTDLKGEVWANRATLTLDPDNKLQKAVLEGNVMIENHYGVQKNHPQCILADRVDYTPATGEIFFQATPPNRVFYVDRLNNFKLSAPALKTKGEGVLGKQIEGLGDVQFDIAEGEWEEIKRRFSLK
jgi:hypothetical protein